MFSVFQGRETTTSSGVVFFIPLDWPGHRLFPQLVFLFLLFLDSQTLPSLHRRYKFRNSNGPSILFYVDALSSPIKSTSKKETRFLSMCPEKGSVNGQKTLMEEPRNGGATTGWRVLKLKYSYKDKKKILSFSRKLLAFPPGTFLSSSKTRDLPKRQGNCFRDKRFDGKR